MNLIKNLLATAILAGATFLPQANASTVALGNITPGADQSLWGAFFGGNPKAGAFDDFFTFTVSNVFTSYDITGSTITSASTFTGKADTFSYFALETSTGTVLETGVVGIDGTGHATAYLPDSFSIGNGNYRLELQGTSSGHVANYGGSISISAVPEAAEWSMMLLGLSLVSMVARRKQA